MNTIFAQCSAHGKAGVSVFRISGNNAHNALQQLIKSDVTKLKPRNLYYKKIYDKKNNLVIDEAMVVFFEKNSSFTGEESVELYTHGSLAVIKLINETLISFDDLRIAEAGEFARRAFLNGKLDLTAAEGLADLIDAETFMQHKQAINQLGGSLQKIYDKWRAQLLELIGLIEAYIDFPDEDIPESTAMDVNRLVQKLISEIRMHLDDDNRGERLRNGIKLAIIGRPNVGKSSLLNYLMQREIAIVSDIAGTTRDVIEGHIDIGGFPIILQDTAGIRDHTQDVIEQEGIRRALQAAQNSDIKIIIMDASKNENINEFVDLIDDNSIIIINKIDMVIQTPINMNQLNVINISIKKEFNMDLLMSKIEEIAKKIASPSESPQITRARHRAQLEKAIEYMSVFSLQEDLVLAAEDLRMTMRSISNITGQITVDEILGEIFSNFCIGK